MWMLNHQFPYDKPEVARFFSDLRKLLLEVLNEKKEAKFHRPRSNTPSSARNSSASLRPRIASI